MICKHILQQYIGPSLVLSVSVNLGATDMKMYFTLPIYEEINLILWYCLVSYERYPFLVEVDYIRISINS